MNFVLQWSAWQTSLSSKDEPKRLQSRLKKNVIVWCVSPNRAPTCVWGDFLRLWKMSLLLKLKRTSLIITSAASLKLSSWKIKITFTEIHELLTGQTLRLKKGISRRKRGHVVNELPHKRGGEWKMGGGMGCQKPADWPVSPGLYSCFEKGCQDAKKSRYNLER